MTTRYEDLAVGQSAEHSRMFGEREVTLFAELTGDVNPIHLDEAYASSTRFGGRIAHGMLTAGLVSAVLGTELPGPGAIYLSQSIRFTRPVHLGDTVTARAEVVELMPEKRRVRLATVCTNQHGEVVLDGEATLMLPAESG